MNLVDTKNSYFEGAKVYMDNVNDKKYQTFIQFDISKDFFLGWNPENKSITVIPFDKINKIESFDFAKIESYGKANSNMDNEEYNIVNTVKDYYRFRTQEINASKVATLFTAQYYQEKYSLISIDLLQKMWEQNKEYNETKLSDFFGYDMSVPQNYLISSNSGLSNRRKVIYVIEYWKDSTKYMKYTLSNENNSSWMIDNIEISSIPFQFKEK